MSSRIGSVLLASAMLGTSQFSVADVLEEAAKQRHQEIQTWDKFTGAWEGTLSLIASPNNLEGSPTPLDYRISLDSSGVAIFVREPGNTWVELDGQSIAHQANEITVLVEHTRSGGAWVETYQFLMARIGRDEAKAFVQRVVNNWSASGEVPDTAVFSQQRAGLMRRIHQAVRANHSLQPTAFAAAD